MNTNTRILLSLVCGLVSSGIIYLALKLLKMPEDENKPGVISAQPGDSVNPSDNGSSVSAPIPIPDVIKPDEVVNPDPIQEPSEEPQTEAEKIIAQKISELPKPGEPLKTKKVTKPRKTNS